MKHSLARILATLAFPLGAAVAQTREIAFIANSSDGTVALLDVATRSIVGRINVNPAGTMASGPGAANYVQDTDVSPDGRTLYVSRAYLGDVAAFEIATGKLRWTTPLNTGRADHMTLSRDGRSLFVSAMFDNRIYRIDAATGRITGHVVGGVYTHDNKISADGKLLYNTSIGALKGMPRPADAAPLTETPGAEFQVTVVDVATLETRERIRTDEGIRPWDFALDGKGMYAQVANKHEVVYFDLASKRITRRLELPVKPGITAADYDFEAPHHGLSITEGGRTLCVSSRASDYAALVSAPDLKQLAVIPVGDGPGWAETADNGRLCLVTNTRSDDLSIISIAERKEIARLPIGDGPKHVTIARIPRSLLRDTSMILGRVERDLTGDGRPEVLTLVGMGKSIDSLGVTFAITSGQQTLYFMALRPITRTIGFDRTSGLRSRIEQRKVVNEFGSWFFDSRKFLDLAQFLNEWRGAAPRRLDEIPQTIAYDGGFPDDTVRARGIWNEIRRSGVTIFMFSPGGDSIIPIAWSRNNGRFYQLVSCC